MNKLLILIPLSLCSCSTMQVKNDRYGFFPYDKQDRVEGYNKYNLMDSPDGSKDPTANVKVWGATY